MSYKRWKTFEEARQYVRDCEFNSAQEFKVWAATPERPWDIPSTPHRDYKKEWTNWSDFLGTKLPYEESKAIAQSYGITTRKEYMQIENLPRGMRRQPDKAFKVTGEWEGWDVFLGVNENK